MLFNYTVYRNCNLIEWKIWITNYNIIKLICNSNSWSNSITILHNSVQASLLHKSNKHHQFQIFDIISRFDRKPIERNQRAPTVEAEVASVVGRKAAVPARMNFPNAECSIVLFQKALWQSPTGTLLGLPPPIELPRLASRIPGQTTGSPLCQQTEAARGDIVVQTQPIVRFPATKHNLHIHHC